MARIIFGLQITGSAVLLICAIGSALLGDWGSVALAGTAAFLLLVL